jgi:hypothetical protein
MNKTSSRYIYVYLLYKNTQHTFTDPRTGEEHIIWKEEGQFPTLDEAQAKVGRNVSWTPWRPIPLPGWVTPDMDYPGEAEYFSLANTWRILEHPVIPDVPIPVVLTVRQPVKSEARNNVEFAIRMALAGTGHQTGLTVPTGEIALSAIMQDLFSTAHRWAVKAYLAELEQEPPDAP